MKTAQEFCLDLWRDRFDLLPLPERRPLSYGSMVQTEWSSKFEKYMRNRLLIGGLRYGLLNAPEKKCWSRMEHIQRKLDDYEETGNLECLVDIANLAMLEFEEGVHPRKHFRAQNDEYHTEEKK